MSSESLTAVTQPASDDNNASEVLPPLVTVSPHPQDDISTSTLSIGEAVQQFNSEIPASSPVPASITSNTGDFPASDPTPKTNGETCAVVSMAPALNAETAALNVAPTKYPLQDDVQSGAFKSVSSLPRNLNEATPSRAVIQVYPPALAKHEEVIKDPQLFTDTLNKFHSSLGSKIMIPKIGGSYLDLHLLYREVTARGGLQQVIKNRIWKEIKAVFEFPRTATNASFVLRKYYTSLLHHYEQVYFLGAQGPFVPPPASFPSPSPQSSTSVLCNIGSTSHDDSEPVRRKKKRRQVGLAAEIDPAACIGQFVTGAIDGKFEHGYLVTVRVGSESLRGVMYSVPQNNLPQFAMLPVLKHSFSAQSFLPGLDSQLRRKRRKKSQMPYKDPNAPKSNRSGYNFFFAEQHARLKLLHPDKDREISRMIGDLWNKLSDEDKLPYQEQGQKDKERYKKEIVAYREKLQMMRVKNANGSAAHEVVAVVCEQPASKNEFQDESEREDEFHVSYNTYSVGNLPSTQQHQCVETQNLEAPFTKGVCPHEGRHPIHELGAYG
ncbi:hypothetical protein O6H91_01G113100 [Diphasiastrum complanatum]|uniref:Uncharacterized protein n=1 Tax=Diphasiastrum complanatum TaxID=34168 RepID=A0ACC2EUW4_DIPCM|nr:hypothetical protein O6H91_01G113100 [Diphasiastrum complanatum]